MYVSIMFVIFLFVIIMYVIIMYDIFMYVMIMYVIIMYVIIMKVTCLTTDAYLTADPGVSSSIPPPPQTFLEINHEIISRVILLPSAESFKKGCCQ